MSILYIIHSTTAAQSSIDCLDSENFDVATCHVLAFYCDDVCLHYYHYAILLSHHITYFHTEDPSWTEVVTTCQPNSNTSFFYTRIFFLSINANKSLLPATRETAEIQTDLTSELSSWRRRNSSKNFISRQSYRQSLCLYTRKLNVDRILTVVSNSGNTSFVYSGNWRLHLIGRQWRHSYVTFK